VESGLQKTARIFGGTTDFILSEWLAQRSGEKRAAPQILGSAGYDSSAKAPGTYVVEP
jgi:poly(3-hydroxyalkanoate) synthetase